MALCKTECEGALLVVDQREILRGPSWLLSGNSVFTVGSHLSVNLRRPKQIAKDDNAFLSLFSCCICARMFCSNLLLRSHTNIFLMLISAKNTGLRILKRQRIKPLLEYGSEEGIVSVSTK